VVGQRTGRKFRLGDELEVTIKAVDMDRRAVDSYSPVSPQ
jgi:exoribonuclease R